MSPKREFEVVGKPVAKLDGLALARGGKLFVADLLPRGCLVGRILTSPYAHARIASIDASAAEALPGVHAVLHHGNVPRVMRTTAGQGAPEPSPYDFTTFDRKVRFVGDRVAAVAAESEAIAEEALKRIKVEYEVLPAVLDVRHAMDKGAPVIHDEPDCKVVIPVPYEPGRNLAAHVDTRVGDTAEGYAEADVVLEHEYECQYAQHTPIEPHAALAEPLPDGRLRITTSTQVPFHVRRIVAQALGWPVSRLHVVKPRVGGGFGAKQEVLIEDVAAFLATRAGRPVYLELSRSEEFLSRTRHPMVVRLKTGARKDGSLTAVDLGVLSNTGAYGSHALTVACNCGSKVLPLYRWPRLGFQADAVYTNLPVGGAYRGYGATQAYIAMEIQMDELAQALGLDPLEFRLRNHIRKGETSPIFAALGEGGEGVEQSIDSIGLDACIRQGARAIGWKKKRGKPGAGPLKRGVGMCCLMQGSSIPKVDMGGASLKMNEDGGFNLLVGATDLGTGSDTVLAQIAAEVLGVSVEQIVVRSSDTDLTPFDVGAYASSTTYLSGQAVRKAALDVAGQIREVAAELLDARPAEIALAGGQVRTADGRALPLSRVAMRSLYEHDQRQIAAFASHITHKSPPPFSAHFAEVEVDTETGLVRVVKYVAAVDCGTAINPQLSEGQTEGAVLNGISYALCEEYLFDEKGRMRNDSLREYKIFSTRDMPELVTILVPTYEKTGPYGAKSVSEIGINGPIPAISNAIFDAVGVRLRRAPFTPERVLAALDELAGRQAR
ncbi:MAG TPA: molybdopterin-dependent oxidoreductase [Myxococcota bacterium]|nr:molybdopterin-dependent oxidoreductase [Myxococcota bacterium]HRY96882.1 molybdopterin-dependent oxidoreductase [Myxococcota bacterium]HSA22275.1 molybdopterin-dependent oxidoreductase [Myxococcota bacterium]